jgi:hypothetical protein
VFEHVCAHAFVQGDYLDAHFTLLFPSWSQGCVEFYKSRQTFFLFELGGKNPDCDFSVNLSTTLKFQNFLLSFCTEGSELPDQNCKFLTVLA